MMDKLLIIKEIPKILRVSDWSVNRYVESGWLKVSKIGQWRISQKDLEEFLKENSNVGRKIKKKH